MSNYWENYSHCCVQGHTSTEIFLSNNDPKLVRVLLWNSYMPCEGNDDGKKLCSKIFTYVYTTVEKAALQYLKGKRGNTKTLGSAKINGLHLLQWILHVLVLCPLLQISTSSSPPFRCSLCLRKMLLPFSFMVLNLNTDSLNYHLSVLYEYIAGLTLTPYAWQEMTTILIVQQCFIELM